MITIIEVARRRDAIRAGNTRTLQEMAGEVPEGDLRPSQMRAAEALLEWQAAEYARLRDAAARRVRYEVDAIFDSGRRAA